MKKENTLKTSIAFWMLHAFIMAALLAFTNASAQQIKQIDHSNEWKVFFSNEYVIVEYHYLNCNLPSNGTNEENLYLRFTNKTTHSLTLNWRNELWYEGICYGCNGSEEFAKSITLSPNEIKEGVCADQPQNPLKIFSRMLLWDTRKLTGFDLKNISATIN